MIGSLRVCRFAFCALLCGAIAFAPGFVMAQAPTIPDLGVDLADWVPVVLTALGVLLSLAVGVMFSIMLLRKGITWVRRAFR